MGKESVHLFGDVRRRRLGESKGGKRKREIEQDREIGRGKAHSVELPTGRERGGRERHRVREQILFDREREREGMNLN